MHSKSNVELLAIYCLDKLFFSISDFVCQTLHDHIFLGMNIDEHLSYSVKCNVGYP